MHVVFIIGPYRSDSICGVVANIRRAELAAIDVWQLGAVALCPHKNSSLMDGMVPDEVFLAGGREMLGRCDACYLVDGWRDSLGSLEEIGLAASLEIPVAHSLEELRKVLRGLERYTC